MTLAIGAVLAGLARVIGLDPAAEIEVGILVILVCAAGPAGGGLEARSSGAVWSLPRASI
jgi:hypothetical protein